MMHLRSQKNQDHLKSSEAVLKFILLLVDQHFHHCWFSSRWTHQTKSGRLAKAVASLQRNTGEIFNNYSTSVR